MRKLPDVPGILENRANRDLLLPEDITSRFVSAANAIDFAISYMECLLHVSRYAIHRESTVNSEMRWWLPYGLHPAGDGKYIPVNRRYKPVGNITTDWARNEDYDQLFTQLHDEQLVAIAHRKGSDGYL